MLNNFCAQAGESINKGKSKLFFSGNISAGRQFHMSQVCGIPSTMEFGSYLGVDILQGRVTKRSFLPLIERIQNRLYKWKANTLNFSG